MELRQSQIAWNELSQKIHMLMQIDWFNRGLCFTVIERVECNVVQIPELQR